MRDEFTTQTFGAETVDPAVANLDESYLSATFGDEADFLIEVLETFIMSSSLLQTQIRQAVENGDAATIRSLAHTLKGSSRMVGANLFATHCQDMEVEDAPTMFRGARRVLAECDILLAECQRRLRDLKST